HGSGTAISRETLRLAGAKPDFSSRLSAAGLAPDAAGCAALARAGAPEAAAIYRQAAVYLGRGFAYAVNLLNPQAVIIGGGVSNSFDLIEGTIKETISACAAARLAGVDVIRTGLGYNAALLGAAALALNARKQ
ncbi:MAG: ROK family protein, partial [Kiritimatiellaeota bacterium]|nr:ROK family protein [Kiritimatiellota bacterium]